MGLEQRCELSNGVWSRTPAGTKFGAIIALKYDMWWQQF